MRFFLSHTLSF